MQHFCPSLFYTVQAGANPKSPIRSNSSGPMFSRSGEEYTNVPANMLSGSRKPICPALLVHDWTGHVEEERTWPCPWIVRRDSDASCYYLLVDSTSSV